MRKVHRVLSVCAGLVALLAATPNTVRGQSFAVGDAPTLDAPAARVPVGAGLGLQRLALTDIDDVIGGGTVADSAHIELVTVIDPQGRATVLADDEWKRWSARQPGYYLLLVTLDDGANYADDDPITYQFTVEVVDTGGCISCNGGADGALGAKCDLDGGVSLQFRLGLARDGDSAGVLRVLAEQPSTSLATPAALFYDLEHREDCVVVRSGNDLRQVLTPHVLADIITIHAYEYEIRFFALEDVGAQHGGLYQVTTGEEFKKWVIENPNGAQAYNELHVTEYVAGSQRVRYEYSGAVGLPDWTLTTVDVTGPSPVVLRVESLDWVTVSGTVVERQYVEQDGSSNELYRVYEQYTQYDWGWRRTERRIDPLGAALTTTWSWGSTDAGLVLQSEQEPYGRWTWYNCGPDENGDWIIERISGWKDQAFVSDPATDSAGVRSTVCKYDASDSFRLAARSEYTAGSLIAHTEYTYSYSSGAIAGSLSAFFLDIGRSTPLEKTVLFADGDETRPAQVVHANGLRDDYDRDDTVGFTPSATPATTPATYDLGGDDGYHYRETVHGYADGGSIGIATGQSTREVVITDARGLPVYKETWAYMPGGQQRIAWTNRTYDAQFRLTGVYRHDGTFEETDYSSCCTRTVRDSRGVETTYTNDVLGRVHTVTRSGLTQHTVGDVTYPAQAALTTTYDYDTPGVVVVTESAGALSRVTVHEYDGAKRIVAVTTGSGTGALKTLYEYGTSSAGGRRVTVYRDYPTNAIQGIVGARDEVTEYYCDDQVQSIAGSTVVGKYYDYGSGAGETWMKVATGTSLGLPRYEKTYRDMLGRISKIEKPGWHPSSAITITTAYHYNSTTGLLERVETPGMADTLYGYDDMAQREYTCLDIDDDGAIDLGGSDRITRTQTRFEWEEGVLWQTTRSWVYATDNSSTATETGSMWVRLTGFSGDIVHEMRRFDALGNRTTTTKEVDPDHALTTLSIAHPDAGVSNCELRVSRADRLESHTTRDGVTTVYAYDDLGRRTHVTDGRGNTTETAYDASGRIDWVEDAAGSRSEFVYYGDAAYNPGRLYYIENASDARTYFDYNDRGQTVHTWGDVPFPTENTYNDLGERTSLRTYRGGSNWSAATWSGVTTGTADETVWSYDEATGLLERKEYADSEAVTYTYTSDGKLDTRSWARGVTTDYSYSAASGELISIDYSDSTPDVTFSYTRTGRKCQVTDAAGTRTFAYDGDSLALATETLGTTIYNGQVLTQVYEDGIGGTVTGRFAGFEVGTPEDTDAYYAAGYAYDACGRLSHVTGPGLPTGDGSNNGAWYTYLADSRLIDQIQFKDSNSNVKAWREWTYDVERDLITSLENNWGDLSTYTTISQYGYGYDALARRTYKQRTGLAFSSSYYQQFGYDDRNQLTAADYYSGTYGSGSHVSTDDLTYAYDAIGNRITHAVGEGTQNEVQTEYDASQLNQYYRTQTTTTVPAISNRSFDPDGNLTHEYIVGDMNCDGLVNSFDISAFNLAVNDPEAYAQTYPGCDILNGDANGDGYVDGKDVAAFSALLTGGNAAIYRQYTWDAENRLIRVEPGGTPQTNNLKVEFQYDYRGRRIEKKVWTYNAGWSLTEHLKFIWGGAGDGPDDGWLLLLELDGASADAVLRRYTWGLDVAGLAGRMNSLAAAGGIGGLLAVQDAGASQDYVYFHDALGSVGQVLDLAAPTAGAAMAAKYEYDPYGNQTGVAGGYDQPFRFSGKYHDAETGLGYWGYRYYNPVLGRWINRDPLEEAGGVNLYAYCANEPAAMYDALGLSTPLWKRLLCCPFAYQACRARTGNVAGCLACAVVCLISSSDNACHACDGMCNRSTGVQFFICDTGLCSTLSGVCHGCPSYQCKPTARSWGCCGGTGVSEDHDDDSEAPIESGVQSTITMFAAAPM
jgi:RHS repeat-associated protein